MPVKSATWYVVECDTCGTAVEADWGVVLSETAAEAIGTAFDSGFSRDGDKWFCEECIGKYVHEHRFDLHGECSVCGYRD